MVYISWQVKFHFKYKRASHKVAESLRHKEHKESGKIKERKIKKEKKEKPITSTSISTSMSIRCRQGYLIKL
jgi:hypothetical protein